MSQQAMEELVDRYMSDPQFREQMRSDPEGTARSTGLDLTPDEWERLRTVDWTQSNEELAARASKIGVRKVM